MIRSWRLLLVAAVMAVMAARANTAAAQTVIVKSAAPSASVEVMVGSTPSGTATTNELGDATVTLNPPVRPDPRAELVAQVYVDTCGTRRRVTLTERDVAPPPVENTCTRRQVGGAYVLRRETSLVIDVSTDSPMMRISQGPAPSDWLRHGPPPVIVWPTQRRGVVFSVGGGLSKLSHVVDNFCGSATTCSGKRSRPAYSYAATYWITPFLGAEVAYVKPTEIKINGSGTGYDFTNSINVNTYSFSGKIAAPVRRARLFAQAGATYSLGDFLTVETLGDRTLTIDGVSTVVQGGPQTFSYKTKGWGWTVGGGLEIWWKPWFGFYTQIGFSRLKGHEVAGGEGRLADRTFNLLGGVQLAVLR